MNIERDHEKRHVTKLRPTCPKNPLHVTVDGRCTRLASPHLTLNATNEWMRVSPYGNPTKALRQNEKGGRGEQEAPHRTDPRCSPQRILLSRLGFTVITNSRPARASGLLHFPQISRTTTHVHMGTLLWKTGSKAQTLVHLPASLFCKDWRVAVYES